ncbi:MAG: hypothetical protein BJG00_011840 [Limnothrix sp. CACIAM 69d]|nr:MAG: hypothetical protein BJG00_011840 [Limnothrix sp. CACIAM 69d]
MWQELVEQGVNQRLEILPRTDGSSFFDKYRKISKTLIVMPIGPKILNAWPRERSNSSNN